MFANGFHLDDLKYSLLLSFHSHINGAGLVIYRNQVKFRSAVFQLFLCCSILNDTFVLALWLSAADSNRVAAWQLFHSFVTVTRIILFEIKTQTAPSASNVTF